MKKQKCTYTNVFSALLCVFLVIIPWVSHLKFWELSESMTDIFSNENGIYIDLFMYYKEVAVICMGIMVLCFFVGEYIFVAGKRKNMPLMAQENRWILKCVITYIGAVILSAIFSKDRYTTIMGIPTEGEGVFALISYMLLFLGVINYLREKRDWKIFRYALRFLMVITILLVCVEFFYQPLFEIPFFQNMLAGTDYKTILESIENESFRNFVVLTFYNPNYFGGFCLLLIPFATKDLVKSESMVQRLGYGVCLSGLYFSVITAKSTASLYLAILEGVMLFAITWITEKEGRKRLFANIGVFLASFCVVFLVAFLINGTKLEQVSTSALKNQRYQELEIAPYRLSDIKMEENKLIFYMDEDILTVVSNEGSVEFFDGEGKAIAISIKGSDTIALADEKFNGITIQVTGNQFAFDFGYENLVYFLAINDEFYGLGQNGQLLKTVSLGNMKDRFGTEIYGWITGRGYAWVNTLPILKSTWLIGKGAGNFSLYFPQYDYVGLLNTHGSHELVADKPHSMYLQIAVNQGIVGLLAILVLFVGTIIRYVKIRFKYNGEGRKPAMADAAFTAFVAFILYSGCNDSTVVVNPVFWMVYGSLVAVLFAMKKGDIAE